MIAATGSLDSLRSLAASGDAEAAKRVAHEFEALVVGEMLRIASRPIGGSHPLDGGSAGRMAREQLNAELARVVSQGRGLGLARQLESQMRGETAVQPSGRSDEAVEGEEST